ncbi:replication initiation protein [Niallia sp. FSL R7-0271]|uniref:replication initiation protein n=1 Tax=Niallia sp. FSL R7-0271 TaxID=2921678 RepID=UPI0030F990A7
MDYSIIESENELDSISTKNWVTKSNELIESTYKLSLQEQRILLVMASKVQPKDETLKTYRFRARDFIEIIGNSKKTGFYSYLREIVNGLQTKVLTIKKDGKQRNYSWVITSIYEDNEGYITLQFHPELKGFFLELKDKFTSYQLENVVRLNSVYSIRIYELLKQYERIRKRKLTLMELRTFLGIEPTKYKQYGHFKSKVLLVAQNEINNTTDINFQFNEIKTGRKVTSIEFIINSTSNFIGEELSLEEDEKLDEEQLSLFDELQLQLSNLGVKSDKIDWLIKEFPEEQIRRNIAYVLGRKGIKQKAGYTVKAIQLDYANSIEDEESKQQLSDPAEEAVRGFIKENVPKRKVKRIEHIPIYMLGQPAIKFFSKYVSEEEAAKIWEARQEEIYEEIIKQSKKKLITT